MHYVEEARKVIPLYEVLTNVKKCLSFTWPISRAQGDSVIKIIVGLQLSYKTIENLGTDKHLPWRKKLEMGQESGCFGLTEVSHGSNVSGMLTTATYDHKK